MYADSFCSYEEAFDNDVHGYFFTGVCHITKKPYNVFVPSKELYAYRQGALIQDALKSVSAEDREFLMSGTSPEGWKKIFGGKDV
jgi:hypothetical protein